MTVPPARRIVFDLDALFAMQRGIRALVAPIRATLGPRPRYVAVAPAIPTRPIELLDNGGVIARRILELPDRDADMGAMLLRQLLWHLHESAGDSTATAAVLFESVYTLGLKFLAAGGSAVLLRQALEEGVAVILQQMASQVVPAHGQHEMTRAAQSICHDLPLAKKLGEIFDVIGEHGEVDIRTGYDAQTRCEYLNGALWPGSIIAKEMLPGSARAIENPAVLISDFAVDGPRDLLPAAQAAMKAGFTALLLIVSQMNASAVGFVVKNGLRGPFQMLAVKAPGDINTRPDILEDIALLTGGQALLTQAGDRLETVKPEHLGRARQVWANDNRFGIVGGKGDPLRLIAHVEQLRRRYDQTDDLTRQQTLQERLGKFGGGSAVLWVGGLTIADCKARKELAQRTARTLRGVVRSGVLPGGGVALLACRPALQQRMTRTQTAEARAAYHILIQAAAAPARAILENAGCDASDIMAQIERAGAGRGFDVEQNRMVQMIEAGVLDSAAAYPTAVQRAISGAAQALTVSVLIHHRKPELAMNT